MTRIDENGSEISKIIFSYECNNFLIKQRPVRIFSSRECRQFWNNLFVTFQELLPTVNRWRVILNVPLLVPCPVTTKKLIIFGSTK